MVEIILNKDGNIFRHKREKLEFVDDTNHKILTKIDDIYRALTLSVINHSFLEGWTNKNLLGLGVTDDSISKQPYLCSMIATSATTGPPKLCVYDRSSLENIQYAEYREDFRDMRIYNSLSFSHSYTYPGTVIPMMSVAELYYIDRSKNPLNFIKAIKDFSINMVVTVPAQIKLWCKLNVTFPEVTTLYSAGAPFPYSYLISIREMFPHARIINNYGATECGPRIGKMQVMDEESFPKFKLIMPAELTRKEGQMQYRSTRMMSCYFGNRDKIEYYKLNDKIFIKGDTFTVHGRHDDVHNLGGKKVSRKHLESILKERVIEYQIAIDEEKQRIQIYGIDPSKEDSLKNYLSELLLIERSYIEIYENHYPRTFK